MSRGAERLSCNGYSPTPSQLHPTPSQLHPTPSQLPHNSLTTPKLRKNSEFPTEPHTAPLQQRGLLVCAITTRAHTSLSHAPTHSTDVWA
ncbi:MAG: hypothetical protein EBT08_12195 [Betaproteobacteria bacterium]|nr:hypothetical protein [Betaproteobacteria bacterium]